MLGLAKRLSSVFSTPPALPTRFNRGDLVMVVWGANTVIGARIWSDLGGNLVQVLIRPGTRVGLPRICIRDLLESTRTIRQGDTALIWQDDAGCYIGCHILGGYDGHQYAVKRTDYDDLEGGITDEELAMNGYRVVM